LRRMFTGWNDTTDGRGSIPAVASKGMWHPRPVPEANGEETL
jgi:hypothetical protein